MSSPSLSVAREFNVSSFLWRFAAATVLVLATYNPSGYSYYHWVRAALANDGFGPEHFVAGVLLLIGWAILLVATQRALGTFGLILAAVLLGGIVWWLVDLGLLALGTVSALSWVILVCLAAVLAIGLSWSHIWRRTTGQFEVDDTD